MAELPGEGATWGPNLWLVVVSGRMEISGTGHLEAVPLGRPDVAPLIEASGGTRSLGELRPALRRGLAARGWAPRSASRANHPSARALEAAAPPPPDPSFPLLIWVLDGRARLWNHASCGGMIEVGVGDLEALAPSEPIAVRTVHHSGLDRSLEESEPMPVPDAHSEPPRGPRRWRGRRARGTGSATARAGGSTERVPVWFATCAQRGDGSPLALGMVQSAIRAFDSGRLLERYDLRPIRVDADALLADVAEDDRRGVLMLSNYLWTVGHNLRLAAAVKRRSPETITVFGGPSAPKYEADAERFFRTHPQVDVIVRGEGEVTASELLAALDGTTRLEALTDVPGLTVRIGSRLVRTPERERISDLDTIPSPYAEGLFDHLVDMDGIWAIETNRGCPYGCTFCDWGSATLSRVRKFDMDRVLGEIDWLAHHGIQSVFVADANFGMFARDVDIARRLTDQSRIHHAPTSVLATFAKNTTKHTLPIASLLRSAGMATEATLSFQSTDDDVLKIIRRHNVRRSTYDEMADEARERGVPVLSDLMLGLPGSTLETVKTDLQSCIDGDVTVRMFGTIVLPNSPMNDPDYREEHGIETDSAQQLVACSTFTRPEREEMVRFRDVHRLTDHFGILREVIRYAQDEVGQRAIDVLWDLYRHSLEDPAAYPLTSWLMQAGRRYLTPPLGWEPFFDEIHDLLVDRVGVPDDTALATVLAVQRAVLPAPGRTFPHTLELDHDYAAYRRARNGPTPTLLRTYGPASFTVEDPNGLCATALKETLDVFLLGDGSRLLISEGGFMGDDNWELESPISRPQRGMYFVH